jgi:transketolase
MRTYQNPREVYGNVLLSVARENPNIVVLDADLCKSTMTCLIEQELPDQYFEMGIGEQNMMSIAGGLALTGKISFVNSFAIFLTSRAFDQVRQAIGITGLNVKIIGSSAGLSDAGDGSTHQTVEDIAIMRAIPGMVVIAPSDANQLASAVRAINSYHGPVYLRYSRNNMAEVHPANHAFEIGKVYPVREGRDVAVFSTGDLLSKVLDVADRLNANGLSIKVIDVPTIKPLDRKAVIEHARQTGAVVTVEEHSILGGFGSAIAEALRLEKIPIEFVGINDVYGTSAKEHSELLEHYGLTEENIEKAIQNVLKLK